MGGRAVCCWPRPLWLCQVRLQSNNIKTILPTAIQLTSLTVFGNGWDYTGRATNIKLVPIERREPGRRAPAWRRLGGHARGTERRRR